MIPKDQFCLLLSAVQEQIDEDNNFATIASDYFGCSVHNNANLKLIKAIAEMLDSTTGCCAYVYGWIFESDFGRNRRLASATDMAYELRGITNPLQLYEFLEKKQNKEDK